MCVNLIQKINLGHLQYAITRAKRGDKKSLPLNAEAIDY